MNTYIFITTEGATFQPKSQVSEPDIDNCQVLGYGDGNSSDEAFQNMLEKHNYLPRTTFDEVICLELKNEDRNYYYLSDYRQGADKSRIS